MAAIITERRNGNLHVTLEGLFTTNTAAQLTIILAKSYTGRGVIFIHTAELTNVEPDSIFALNNLLGLSRLPKNNIYITGAKGLNISHDTEKVIVYKKKVA